MMLKVAFVVTLRYFCSLYLKLGKLDGGNNRCTETGNPCKANESAAAVSKVFIPETSTLFLILRLAAL